MEQHLAHSAHSWPGTMGASTWWDPEYKEKALKHVPDYVMGDLINCEVREPTTGFTCVRGLPESHQLGSHVHIHIHIHIHIHMHIHMHIHIRVHIRIHLHMYMYMYICTYTYTHTDRYIYICRGREKIHIYIYVYIYIHTYIHIHTCMRTYTHIYIYRYEHIYVCMRISLCVCVCSQRFCETREGPPPPCGHVYCGDQCWTRGATRPIRVKT